MKPKYVSKTDEEEIPTTEFERGRIMSFRKVDCLIAGRVQRISFTITSVWKQWTNERRTTRKTGSGRRKVTSVHDNRPLLCMVVNDLTVGITLVYCYRCTNVCFVNSLTSVALWTACKGAFVQDPSHGKPSTSASAMDS